MIKNFEELIEHSAESELLAYRFEDGRLCVSLRMPDVDDCVVDVWAKTKAVVANVRTANVSARSICFIELLRLTDSLILNADGLFIPSAGLREMLNEVRGGLSLAYGKHRNRFQFILRFRGNPFALVACLVSDLRDLTFSIHDLEGERHLTKSFTGPGVPQCGMPGR